GPSNFPNRSIAAWPQRCAEAQKLLRRMKLSKTTRKRRIETLFLLTVAIAALVASIAGVHGQSTSDASLSAVRSSDRLDKAPNGKFRVEVTAAEHMRRAAVYHANRAFA